MIEKKEFHEPEQKSKLTTLKNFFGSKLFKIMDVVKSHNSISKVETLKDDKIEEKEQVETQNEDKEKLLDNQAHESDYKSLDKLTLKEKATIIFKKNFLLNFSIYLLLNVSVLVYSYFYIAMFIHKYFYYVRYYLNLRYYNNILSYELLTYILITVPLVVIDIKHVLKLKKKMQIRSNDNFLIELKNNGKEAYVHVQFDYTKNYSKDEYFSKLNQTIEDIKNQKNSGDELYKDLQKIILSSHLFGTLEKNPSFKILFRNINKSIPKFSGIGKKAIKLLQVPSSHQIIQKNIPLLRRLGLFLLSRHLVKKNYQIHPIKYYPLFLYYMWKEYSKITKGRCTGNLVIDL